MTQVKTLDYAHAPPADPIPLPRRLAAEFVGTFALVFAGCGAIAAGVDHVGVALAFGLAITTMVIAVGDVSGAHFNPAVSFAFAVSRRMNAGDAVAYVVVQCAGAVLASLLLAANLWLGSSIIYPSDVGATAPQQLASFVVEFEPSDMNVTPFVEQVVAQSDIPEISPGRSNTEILYARTEVTLNPDAGGIVARAMLYELVLTFFLVFVILCVAIGSKERGLMAGIAIGGTVAFCALAGGPVSGASMNPARSLGPALVTGGDAIKYLWIYWTAPFIGALIAVGAWTYIYRHPRMAIEAHSVTKPEP